MAVVLLGTLGEVLFGNIWLPLCLGLAIYGARHLYHVLQLSHLIEHNRPIKRPVPYGPWGIIYRQLRKLKRRGDRTRLRLTRTLKRLSGLSQALPDAAVVVASNGAVEWVNLAARDLLGLSWPAAIGKDLCGLIRDPLLKEYLDNGDYSRPLRLPSPVSQAKIFSLHVNRLNASGERLLIARDITQTHLLDRMRQDFVSNVSHELRTPLTVVRGLLEQLADEELPSADRQRAVELMQGQTDRMADTVAELLILSRLQSEDSAMDCSSVAVADLLTDIVIAARAISASREHKFHLNIPPEAAIEGDESALRSAFSNLVYNAVRHTPPRTEVVISWTTGSDGAALSVADNGQGIPARHIPRLTERFYRVDAGRARDSGGTGLGLAIAKHVLIRHDGELQIRSKPGVGSTFVCRFPTTRVAIATVQPASDHPDATAEAPRHDDPGTAKPKVDSAA